MKVFYAKLKDVKIIESDVLIITVDFHGELF